MSHAAPPLVDGIDWHAAGEEAVQLLLDLIRLDTTNSPGRTPTEIDAATLLADRFRAVGLEPEVLESKPGRGNVIVRLHGDGTGGEPILLSGHLDVVPADPATWSRNPFGAEIHNGWIWGRGAVDMKNMVAMEAMTILLLQRHGVRLKRDVIFAGVADEEGGCTDGSLWLAENHADKIQAEYVISEIGGFTMHLAGKRFYPVQVAEKGMCWLTITAEGTPGHGSLPNRDNPVARLGRAAHLLGTRRLPFRKVPVVERFVRTLADQQAIPNSWVLRGLLQKPLCGTILDNVFPEPGLAATFDAALHNTANPTVLRAGDKVNQVPGTASLRVDGRLLPGQTGQDLIDEIRGLIGPGFVYTIDREMPATETDWDDPIRHYIGEVLERHDPGAIPIQSMIPGFTDAKAYSQLGMKCWGFSPVKLPADCKFAEMFHGNDERIPLEGHVWGTRALFELVTRLAVA